MSFTTYMDAMRVYFETRWGVLGDGTTIVFENLDFKPTLDTPYVLYANRTIDSDWQAPGSSESIGAVTLAVMSPENVGPEAGETRAATVAACLARQDDSGVQYMEATIEPIGSDGNGFYQINVRVPWSYTETH